MRLLCSWRQNTKPVAALDSQEGPLLCTCRARGDFKFPECDRADIDTRDTYEAHVGRALNEYMYSLASIIESPIYSYKNFHMDPLHA